LGNMEGVRLMGTFERQLKEGSGNGLSLIILYGTKEETSV
jgi:hypothetical protein